MSDGKNRNDWGVLVAVLLIAFGLWMLAGRVLGDLMTPVRQALAYASNLAWPLALIGLGVLLLLSSRSGGLHFDVKGKRLYRSRTDRVVGGVLGGLATYLDVDPTILRVGYVLATIALGFWSGVIFYIIAQVVVPEEPEAIAVDAPAPAPPAPPAPPGA